jgi:hypothetical protein
LLQFSFGNDANRAIGPRPVDPDDLAPAVIQSDDAEQRIGRLGAEIGDEPGLQPFAPGSFRDVIDRVDTAIEMGQHHAARRRVRRERHDIRPRAAHIGLHVRGH